MGKKEYRDIEPEIVEKIKNSLPDSQPQQQIQ